jgi:predicted metal-dependent phosphoesterase TrpH
VSCSKSYLIKADLHLHTTASDGAYSPKDLIELAAKKQIKYLAITDHDTLQGLDEAAKTCQERGIVFFPGIEFSTVYSQHEIHILGYNLQLTNPNLISIVKKLQNSRWLRMEKMIAKLKSLGISIEKEELAKFSTNRNWGRLHLALVLQEKGIVNSTAEAFQKYLEPGAKAYVPRYRLCPFETLKIIAKAGGKSVIAHPGLSKADQLIPLLAEKGLIGIEVYHPAHSENECLKYRQLAQKHNLIITGGSDFHGHLAEDLKYLGEMPIPLSTLSYLKSN